MESNRIQITSSQSILELFVTLISCGSAMKALGGFINIIGFVGTVFERKKTTKFIFLITLDQLYIAQFTCMFTRKNIPYQKMEKNH